MGWLGVLGGMGPAATADFLAVLAEVTPAARDQDHLPAIVYSDPTTPDRSASRVGDGPSPVPAMVAGVTFLERAGCDRIAVPCNSAHVWFDELQSSVSIPVLHIVDAVIERLRPRLAPTARVGVLATAGTLASGLYQDRLETYGFATTVPSPEVMSDLVMPAIRAVKAGDSTQAAALLRAADATLRTAGAEAVIVGCTDLSVAVAQHPTALETPVVVDANRALALRCVETAVR